MRKPARSGQSSIGSNLPDSCRWDDRFVYSKRTRRAKCSSVHVAMAQQKLNSVDAVPLLALSRYWNLSSSFTDSGRLSYCFVLIR